MLKAKCKQTCEDQQYISGYWGLEELGMGNGERLLLAMRFHLGVGSGENVLNRLGWQLYNFVNVLKTIELYILNGWILWRVD